MEPEIPRAKITAFIVCKNEETHIGPCIDSVAFCDEILVIDSFSTDRTPQICHEKGVRFLQRAWPGYREQKAFGLEESTHSWVFNLDADERVTPELRESILQVLQQDALAAQGKAAATVHGYRLNRIVYFLDRWWRRGGWYPEYRVRLVRKGFVEWGGVDPHEKPIVQGPVETLAGELEHYTYRDITAMFSRLSSHAAVAGNEECKRGVQFKLHLVVLNPLLRFVKFYIFKRGYREGLAGFIVAVSEAYYTFMKYATLWDCSRNKGN